MGIAEGITATTSPGTARQTCWSSPARDQPYGNYKSLNNVTVTYASGFTLTFDKIQADPFAAPTRAHISIHRPGFALELFSSPCRRTAAADFLTRRFWNKCHDAGGDRGNPAGGRGGYGGEKGGAITIDRPGQHVVERSSVVIDGKTGSLEARFTLSMPARGRSIQGHKAADILLQMLPAIVSSALLVTGFSRAELGALQAHVESIEDQETLRNMIAEAGLVAFVPNGAILPRQSGTSDLPMRPPAAVPFKSPKNLTRSFHLPHRGAISGVAIPKGVTLIVGGGFHGKSTLLQALETGVYNRIPGDGREFVVTDAHAVKIRAEDGRAVTGVNISPFIDNLPGGKTTDAFSSADASGSTSQAANIIEALEVGARALLIDEDTAATNFMIRDHRMQQLVKTDPITPFLHRVRALSDAGISSILVVGGCGDYFEVADLVICMESYVPSDKTAHAREICGVRDPAETPTSPFGTITHRAVIRQCLSTQGKVKARRIDCLQFDQIDIDLGCVEQLVEVSQVRAIADILHFASKLADGSRSLATLLDLIEDRIDEGGLDAVSFFSHPGSLARPRRQEIAAAINRLRVLRTNQVDNAQL